MTLAKAASRSGRPVSDPNGPTGKLCEFLHSFSFADVPDWVVDNVQFQILDGIGCGLLASRLPWSALAVEALTSLEGEGDATVWGWDRCVPPTAAALLNGTFIQGFELDDYYHLAPLHPSSCLLPALFATAEHVRDVTGTRFLEAAIAGYEAGPRIGLAMGGLDMLSRGWHCGAIFGAIASTAAIAKLYQLDAAAFEDAIGIGATQASGLMSAQYEAMVKRMHSGMAARSGVLAGALANQGFVGIKRVLEREYGGLIPTFCANVPSFMEKITNGLGEQWEAGRLSFKPWFACMGGLHAGIEAAIALREEYQIRPEHVAAIHIGLADAIYHHGGFKLERPPEAIGAQMNAAYVIAVTLIDGMAFVPQFSPKRLNSDDVWDLIEKTTVVWDKELDEMGRAARLGNRLKITLKEGRVVEREVLQQWGGIDRPLTRNEVRKKFRLMTSLVIDDKRACDIEDMVLDLRSCPDIGRLIALLGPPARSPY